MISEISINFAGEQLTLNQYRSIFWDKEKSLILSDLHLGKTAHFRKELASKTANRRPVGHSDICR